MVNANLAPKTFDSAVRLWHLLKRRDGLPCRASSPNHPQILRSVAVRQQRAAKHTAINPALAFMHQLQPPLSIQDLKTKLGMKPESARNERAGCSPLPIPLRQAVSGKKAEA